MITVPGGQQASGRLKHFFKSCNCSLEILWTYRNAHLLFFHLQLNHKSHSLELQKPIHGFTFYYFQRARLNSMQDDLLPFHPEAQGTVAKVP